MVRAQTFSSLPFLALAGMSPYANLVGNQEVGFIGAIHLRITWFLLEVAAHSSRERPSRKARTDLVDSETCGRIRPEVP
jgi:hypothetical protein